MIREAPQRFTPDDDAIIREHWGTTSSRLIGEMLDPPRTGDRIRIRARRLKLGNVGAHHLKARPGNQNRKRRRPGVVPLRCLDASIDGMPIFDPVVVAADFMRWRESRA